MVEAKKLGTSSLSGVGQPYNTQSEAGAMTMYRCVPPEYQPPPRVE